MDRLVQTRSLNAAAAHGTVAVENPCPVRLRCRRRQPVTPC